MSMITSKSAASGRTATDISPYSSRPTSTSDSLGQYTSVDAREVRTKRRSEQTFQSKSDWTPVWLRVPTLVGFLVVFVVSLVSLIVLYWYSESHNGFSALPKRLDYPRKYGPTAVITVFIVLWSQVDRYCRALTPWANIRRGEGDPDRTVLLDYISPLQPQVLYRAARSKDWAVFVALLGSILLKLTVVSSTGLLLLEPREIVEDVELLATTRFDPTSAAAAGNNPDVAGWMYYGIQANGLPYSGNTTESFAVTDVKIDSERNHPPARNMTASPFVFEARLDCEVATPTRIENDTTVPELAGVFYNVELQSATCKTVLWSERRDYIAYELGFPTKKEHYVPSALMIPCDGSEHADDSADARLLLYLALADSDLAIVNTSAAICKPTYSILQPRVTWSTALIGTPAGVTMGLLDRNKDITIEYETAYNLTKGIFEASTSVPLQIADTDDVEETPTQIDATVYGSDNSLFEMMTVVQGRIPGQSYLRPLLDQQLLITRAQDVFQGLGAQYAAYELSRPASENLNGTLRYTENRLVVNIVSVASMCTLFGVLAMISGLLILLRPRNALPGPTDAIANLCALRAVPRLKQQLSGSGYLGDGELRSHVNDSQAAGSSKTSANGDIELSTKPSGYTLNERALPVSKDQIQSWWRPLIVRPPGFILLLSITFLVIAVLEVLQRRSDSNNGFIGVSDYNPNRLAISYIPAAVMVIISLLYTSLEDNANLLAPYQALRHRDRFGSEPASGTGPRFTPKSVPWFRNHRYAAVHVTSGGLPPATHGNIPIIAIYRALTARYWAASATIIAALFCPFLTIIVSGLYTIEQVTNTVAISLHPTDQLNLSSWGYSNVTDNGAAGLTSGILNNGVKYPLWTSDDLVFPKIVVDSTLAGSGNSTSGSTTATLTALRPVLNCTVVDPSAISWTPAVDQLTDGESGIMYNVTYLNITVEVPNTCPGAPPGVQRFHFTDKRLDVPRNSIEANSTGGQNLTTQTGWSDSVGAFNIFASPETGLCVNPFFFAADDCPSYDINPDGCPSLLFYAANVTVRPGQTRSWNADLSILICSQQFEEVKVNATLDLPDYRFNASQPPLVLEDTARYLDNGTAGVFARSYQISSRLNDFQGDRTKGFYDSVLNHSSSAYQSLFGQQNIANLINATQRGYALYMAQALNANARQPISEADDQAPPPIPATLTSGTWRIKQNMVSARILQGMLGAMAVCGVVAWVLLDTKELLPHCPCSIAGVGSWLADGSLWGEDSARGAEGRFEGQHGHRLALGWHEREAGKTGDGKPERWFGIDKEPI